MLDDEPVEFLFFSMRPPFLAFEALHIQLQIIVYSILYVTVARMTDGYLAARHNDRSFTFTIQERLR